MSPTHLCKRDTHLRPMSPSLSPETSGVGGEAPSPLSSIVLCLNSDMQYIQKEKKTTAQELLNSMPLLHMRHTYSPIQQTFIK